MRGAVAPLFITDAQQDPRFRDHPGLTEYGIRAYLAVPLRRLNGAPIGTLCALDPDSTEKGDVHLPTLEAVADLVAHELERAEATAYRERMLGVLGHDLRSPLQALRLGTSALDSELPSESRALVVERMERAVGRMDEMVTALLGFATLHGPLGLKARIEPLVPEPMLRRIAEDVARGRPLQIELDLPPEVSWDRPRVEQALTNLLENAFRHRSGGPVRLIGVTQGATVSLRVENAGALPEDRDSLFEPFRRGDGASQPGLGLGLYIVRQIVDAHGGTVRAGDGEGLVTMFVDLPTRPPLPADEGPVVT